MRISPTARGREPARCDLLELLRRLREPSALSAERVGGPDGARQPDLGEHQARLVQGVRGAALRHVEADAQHRFLEELPVLGLGDRLGARADELHAVLLEDAALVRLHRAVEAGLAAERGQQRVHRIARLALGREDRVDELRRDGFDVGAIGELRVGHDGGRVGVHEHHPEAIRAQGLAGLGAAVIELAALPDDDGSGADEEDGFDVVALGHAVRRPSLHG